MLTKRMCWILLCLDGLLHLGMIIIFIIVCSNTLTHLFFRGKESENHMRFEIVAGNQWMTSDKTKGEIIFLWNNIYSLSWIPRFSRNISSISCIPDIIAFSNNEINIYLKFPLFLIFKRLAHLIILTIHQGKLIYIVLLMFRKIIKINRNSVLLLTKPFDPKLASENLTFQ